MERYLTGLLTDLPHKTCETIADVIAGTSLERLQHLLTDAAWDPLELDEARVKRLLELHPVTDGILIFDDTGLPKKGNASVGVAPQYSGTLGKIGNCQVVVSAEFLADDPASSTPFHFPVSAQLFLPESWTQDAERRKQARIPEEIEPQTKPEIALGLLDRARQWGVPIQAVVVDAGYGDNPNDLARTRRASGALRLRRPKHVWLSSARRGAGDRRPDPCLWWASAAPQTPSCAALHGQRADRSFARLRLANHQLARRNERHDADPGRGSACSLGHWLLFA